MANDRLYLVCPECGEGYMLAKHYGDEWYTSSSKSDKDFVIGLNNFFEKHWHCLAGVVFDPYKFLLLNELEQMKFEDKMKSEAK
jgi:hypothetical protein